jgi:signal transduction histidine kinase
MMEIRSLKVRVILIAVATNMVALAIIGFVLLGLFEREITGRVHTEIHSHLLQLINSLEVKADGTVIKRKLLTDTRFLKPFSGYYWQIGQGDLPPLRSRSLWDEVIAVPDAHEMTSDNTTEIQSSTLGKLMLHTRLVSLPGASRPLQVMVALSAEQVEVPLHSFQKNLFLSLLVFGAGLALMAAVPLWLVLRPISRLTQEIMDLKLGKRQVGTDYVMEVQPIATELNRLLKHQEESIAKARGRAADFAHSLKTPLAIIEAVLSAVREINQPWAEEIRTQTREILRHIDRELARSRSAAGYGQAVSDLRELVGEIAATIGKLPRSDTLAISIDIPQNISVPMDKDDLTEIIGNLLDNARKWGKGRIDVMWVAGQGQSWLEIRDDGPGVSADMISALGSRGLRLDERTRGTGIGLAIVRDLLEAYGLEVEFLNAQPSGLCVRFQLPAMAP